MTELSNLLRQRLAGGPGALVRPDSHPDTDTLTAYVERLLPAAERNRVIEHLAACAHCREVTTLAFPDAAEQAQQVAAVPATRRWGFLWTPGFIRATVSLATVVVIAAAIFQVRERPADRSKTESFVAPASGGPGAEKDKSADKDTKTNAPASETARLEAPAQPSADALRSRAYEYEAGRAAHSADSFASNRAAPPPPAINSLKTTRSALVGVEAAGTAVMAKAQPPLRRDYVNSEFFAYSASSDGNGGTAATALTVGELPPAPSPRGSNQLPAAGYNAANTMIFADMPTQNTGTQIVRTQAPPSGNSSHWGFAPKLSALESKAKKVLTARTTPAIPPVASTAFAMQVPGQLNSVALEGAAPAPALDGGVSGLEQSGAFARRAIADSSVNAKMESLNGWRISGARLVKPGDAGNWVEACLAFAGVQVTTFAAHANELWAGLANTALLHSRDGGITCEQITLGTSATGTIVRIEARGAVVQVKSSSGQTWSSQDGGKTWKMDE